MPAVYRRQYGRTGVTLVGNDSGMQAMLADEQMLLPPLLTHADESEARAVAAAESYPERDWPNQGSKRRTGKRYTQSFEIEYGVSPRSPESPQARVYVRLINTNPFALYIEYGNRNIKPARRIVRTAAGVNRFDAPGDIYG